MSENPLLEAKDISKAFSEGKEAVKGLSLQLPAGESLAIVGPSGAGKTTLLRLLAGLESPDTGYVVLDGKKLEDPSEQLIAGNKAIRMVHQDFGLAPNRSVESNIDMLLRAYTADYRNEETARLLNAVKLNYLATRPVHTLSGGEKQRLALARALADDSRIILLDEPLSQQDAILKDHLYRVIRDEIRAAGKGMIVVTHDPREAMAVGERIGVLIDGEIVQTGRPQEIYEHPETISVAKLTGRITILPNRKWKELTEGEPLSDEAETMTGYRPESLMFTTHEEGLFTVKWITYQGAYNLIEAIAKGISLTLLTTDTGLSTGDKIKVSRKDKTGISFS